MFSSWFAGSVAPPSDLDRRAGHLADSEQVSRVQTDRRVHLGEELVEPRTIRGEDETVRPGPARWRLAVDELTLGDQVDHVHPEAVDAAVDPPVHHVVDRPAVPRDSPS